MPKYKKLPIIGLVHEWMYVEVFFWQSSQEGNDHEIPLLLICCGKAGHGGQGC